VEQELSGARMDCDLSDWVEMPFESKLHEKVHQSTHAANV